MSKNNNDESEEKLNPEDDFDATEESDKEDVDIGEREIPELNKPKKQISKKEWGEIIKENFPDLYPIANIVLAGLGQLLISDIVNPFGLILVDKPASGKTLVLNFFSDIDELVYADDNFSPASFVTHAANRKREELADIDLLPKIKDKILLVREMAPIFGQSEDKLHSNMTILTRIFDGEGYLSTTGVHGRRGYKGTFMFVFLGASTPIQPRIWKLMSSLGSRLFFVNVNSKEKDEEELTDQLLLGPYQKRLEICKEATSNLIRSIWAKNPKGIIWDSTKTEREYVVMISRIATMLARFRGAVGMWEVTINGNMGETKGTKLNHQIPEIEQPNRINQLLYNFAQGHAVVNGRDSLTENDIKAALKVALESAPYHRTKLLKFLVKKNGLVNSEEVQKMFGCSRPTALKEMEFLHVLGIAQRTIDPEGSELKLNGKFQWLIEEKNKWPKLFE